MRRAHQKDPNLDGLLSLAEVALGQQPLPLVFTPEEPPVGLEGLPAAEERPVPHNKRVREDLAGADAEQPTPKRVCIEDLLN